MAAYSALLSLGLLASAPWWTLRMLTTRRYREGLAGRLGAVPVRLRRAVRGKRVLWVHAVSVGEVLAVSRLVGEMEAALNAVPHPGVAGEGPPHLMAETWIVVISTTTRTGGALARQRFGADRVFPFPLDFAFAVRAYLRALRPQALVLAESELWPRLLCECALRGVPVAVVNARVSDRSFRRAWRVRGLWSRLLREVSLFLTQSEEDARRLTQLGAYESSVGVSGNLKYDVRAPEGSRLPQLIREIAGIRPILVAGSTLGGGRNPECSEAALILQAWEKEIRPRGVLLVLAPRHPENFAEAHSLARRFPSLLATTLLGRPDGQLDIAAPQVGQAHLQAEIIVLDTIGDLAAVYGVAHAAFVGGSLVRRGGHNPLEPAQFGVPVVMGPSFENFRDIVGKMQHANGICLVRDEEDLGRTLGRLFADPAYAQAIGAAGQAVFLGQSGATARTRDALLGLLASSGTYGPEVVPA